MVETALAVLYENNPKGREGKETKIKDGKKKMKTVNCKAGNGHV